MKFTTSAKLSLLFLLPLLFALGCGPQQVEEDIPELASVDILLAGAPDKADLPDEKTDQIPPRQFDLLALQSPVRNQSRRGVCSIFATVALMEHLYIKEGTITDPDFSEQYLQWSVKNEVKDFVNTEGSSASSNLEAITRFGIVEEKYWPYEPYRWSTSNDPECTGGENLPVKCYTNGEPPQAAREAKKWKLPQSRWVSSRVNSIKAFMVNKNQAVIVGGTFYYQAWNHGASTLPVRSDYKRKGYVLYPNAKDREESLKNRAGHAFLLVGWDDDLEVQAVDENGNLMVDGNGNPVMQKGFFLFKNSWGRGSFGVENPKGDGYGWIQYQYVEELSAVASDIPKVELQPEACNNGKDDDLDGKADCADSDCAADELCQGERLEFTSSERLEIPDNNSSGVSSSLEVTLDAQIAALDLQVDISHSYRGDLEIFLRHPDGSETQVLSANSSSGADIKETFPLAAFNGKSSKGRWTLRVADRAAQDTGTLNGWGLRFKVATGGEKVAITKCLLQPPAQFTVAPSAAFTAKAVVYAVGVTDRTTGVDTHPLLVAQLGYGQGDPSGWLWQTADADGTWQDSGLAGHDQYLKQISAPAVTGQYYIAARFSGDGGESWTLCDLDGSENGFQTAQAGSLKVENPQSTPSLIFSEYLEGSSYNKALEIANRGAVGAQLSGCQLRLYINGAATPSRTLQLTGELSPKATLVVCHPNASADILSRCQLTDAGLCSFNGDDALDIICGGQVLDVLGRIGEDPGTAWGSGDACTLDRTLRRKCSVQAGRADGSQPFDPSLEWESYPKDTASDLGLDGC